MEEKERPAEHWRSVGHILIVLHPRDLPAAGSVEYGAEVLPAIASWSAGLFSVAGY